MLAAMALEHDRESARDILQECYRRLSVPNARDEDQNPIVRFFGDFDFGRRITSDVNDATGRSIIEDGQRFAVEHAEQLCDAYTKYLIACFGTALNHHKTFIIDPDGNCPDVPDWLGQAFNLTPYKDDGQPIDLELDADILDGMKFIYQALQEKSEHYGTGLEEHVQRFVDGEAPELPVCIERLITLKGYPIAQEYLPSIRNKVAVFILAEIQRLRGSDHWRQTVAANLVLKCGDACAEQVELLLSRTDISDADRAQLLERREVLRGYSCESLQRHNRSGNAAGFARLHRNHKDKIHSQIKRLPNVRTREETEAFLAEIESDQAKAIARGHSTVQEALRVINSPDVGNHSRTGLKKLQKQTPKEFQFVWPDLWRQFQEALQNVASRQNKA
jgi:hypothetical protein